MAVLVTLVVERRITPVLVVAGASPVGDATAENHGQVVGHVEATGHVGGVLVFLDVGFADGGGVRARALAFPVPDIVDGAVIAGPGTEPATVIRGVFGVAGQGDPGDQFMLATEQGERAGQVGVEVVLARLARPAVGVHVGARAVHRTDLAVHVVDQLVEVHDAVAELDLAAPAVVELMLEGGEDIGLFAVVVRPGWRTVLRAAEVGLAAVGVADLEAGAQRVVDLGIEVTETEGQHGCIAEVELGDTVDQLRILLEAVDEGVLGLVVDHQTPADVAAVGQWAGNVESGAVTVPAASFGGHAALEGRGRALADHVDGRRRGAGAADQAGGATHDFDTVVHRRALGGIVQARGGGNTVDLEVVDLEAARPVGVVLGADAGAQHGDARGGLEHFGQVGQLLVVQALAGDHGDRLRRFLLGQVQARRATGHVGGVQAGAFGDRTWRHARNRGWAQLQCGLAGTGWRYQQDGVAVHAVGQAAALEHALQHLVGRQRAGYRAGLQTLHQFRAVEDLHLRLLTQLLQGAGQRLGGDVDGDLLGVGCAAPQQHQGQQGTRQYHTVRLRWTYGACQKGRGQVRAVHG